MRYEKTKAGEWLRPIRRGYKMRCCDCGLVHKLDFRVLEGRAEFRAYRDERATAASRRKRPTRGSTNVGKLAGAKAEMPNRRRPRAKRDRLSVSNNRRSRVGKT